MVVSFQYTLVKSIFFQINTREVMNNLVLIEIIDGCLA